ncbi:MAG TPA: flagellar biosynthetic protein FliR [Pirellulales bacterium]|jgi:flagellar biosynthetic protein FliR|nr:flagellar biosynthetic protein FliR [Pirellulales bacterium]
MDWLFEVTLRELLVFTLVLARVGGLMMSGPGLGAGAAPLKVRALLALVLASIVTPAQFDGAVEAPASPAGHLLAIGGELVLGYTLGFGVTALFSGVQLAGQIVSQMSGMTLADVYSPGFDSEMPLFSQLLYLVALAVYFAIGGHRLLVSGLLETFAAVPPGAVGIDMTLTDTIVTMIAGSFSLGIRAAAPAAAALLLATLVLGAISRTLPQLNVMSLGLGLNALATFAVLSLSMGAMICAFHDEVQGAVEAVVGSILAGMEARQW